MKRFLLCLMTAAAVLGFTGCSDDDPQQPQLGYQLPAETGGVTVEGNTLSAGYDGAEITLPITGAGETALSVTVTENTSSEEWCTAGIENGSLRLVILPNPDKENGRTAKVTVSSDDRNILPLTLTVGQSVFDARTAGMYILSEGDSFNGVKATLSYYNMENGSLSANYFETQNPGKQLGMLVNHATLYGSKLYLAEDARNMITVIEASTGKLLKEIDLGTGTDDQPCEPRFITKHKGKVYASTYFGGVVKIDTASLSVEAKTPVSGSNPEGIDVSGDKLFVACSGWGSDNRVSVIDLNSFTETGTIETPYNPYSLKTAPDGSIWVVTAGNYSTQEAQFSRIDPVSYQVTTYDIPVSKFDFYGDYAYTCHSSYISYETYIKKVNLRTGAAVDFLADEADASPSVYGVNVDQVSGDVYLSDMSGKVSRFGQDGALKSAIGEEGENGTMVSSMIFRYE